ncbi:MAG: hemerythrin domain-containing protein [Aphanothece sp. CMT-3BRIN-NPC111]|jgi:hemerythrin superfamily protein|nr:hemerythrin domain-containing protein [Aphanothece sp. CMT-3BRIN-NPC111]
MDGIESLEKDHDRIRSLFSELEGTADPHELQDSFDKLGNLLTIHAEAEEQVLYPEARNCEGTAELIDKGQYEHDKGDQMVLAIKSISANESEFKAKVRELQEFMLNHLDEEENDLFPRVRQCMSDNKLDKLGNQLRETKANVAPKVVD